MKSDKQVYQLFVHLTKMLFELLNLKPGCGYTMKSIVFKELEQRSDGILEPQKETEPVYIFEFQAQEDEDIYHREVIEMACYGKTYPSKEIYGILVFTSKSIDPKTPTWLSLTKGKNKRIHVFYLEKELEKLEKIDPNHPLILVFKPFLIKNLQKLEKDAKNWYGHLEKSKKLPKKAKDVFCNVFFTWMAARFNNLTYEEVYSMLASLTPFEETRAYQEIVEKERKAEKKGEKKGETKGEVKGKISTLKELFEEGLLPKIEYQLRLKPLKQQLKELKAMEKKNRLRA